MPKYEDFWDIHTNKPDSRTSWYLLQVNTIALSLSLSLPPSLPLSLPLCLSVCLYPAHARVRAVCAAACVALCVFVCLCLSLCACYECSVRDRYPTTLLYLESVAGKSPTGTLPSPTYVLILI